MLFSRSLRQLLLVGVIFFTSIALVSAAPPTEGDLNIKYDANNGTTHDGYIESFKSSFGGYFFGGDVTGEKGAKFLMITIARDLKNLFIFIAVVFLFVLVLKVLFSSGSDEDAKKWRL